MLCYSIHLAYKETLLRKRNCNIVERKKKMGILIYPMNEEPKLNKKYLPKQQVPDR